MTILGEQIADRLTGGRLSEQGEQIADLRASNAALQVQIGEALSRLEQALYEPGWRRLTMTGDDALSRDGIRQITEISRIMRIKNPIIRRGVEIQRLYTWARGVTVRAADDGINDVIQEFWDDERNRAELTGHQARGEKEEALQTDGNLFFLFFIDPRSGRVRLRSIDPQEVDAVICNPEDKREPWYYKRTYTIADLDGRRHQVTRYYPDVAYKPRPRPVPPFDVDWDTPVLHVAVNRSGQFGVPEFYPANDWAVAYKTFLEQLASVWQALARFSWKLSTTGGAAGVAAARAKLGTTLSTGVSEDTNPPPVTGSIFIGGEGQDIQPMRTGGATLSADDGRRLFLMAASTFGFPETFWSDVSVGTLATARSLDRPTELKILDRQKLWRDVLRAILDLVALEAARAGNIPGVRVVTVADGDQIVERLRHPDTIDPRIAIDFPPIVEDDGVARVGAIVQGLTLGGQDPAGEGIPPEIAVEQILRALGIEDPDEVMTIWRDQQTGPTATATASAEALAAVRAAAATLRDDIGRHANGDTAAAPD